MALAVFRHCERSECRQRRQKRNFSLSLLSPFRSTMGENGEIFA
jgi:hypothetical protein